MVKEKETIANRGMDWEKIISKRVEKYKRSRQAYLFKLPTEWQVQRAGGRIVSAFPKHKSLVDYFGCLKDGRAVSIEAKRTSSKTSFPFDNIAEHQYKFFKQWGKVSDLGYYLIWWRTQDEKYLVHADKIADAQENLGRKSIPYKWFLEEENAIRLDDELNFIEEIEKLHK